MKGQTMFTDKFIKALGPRSQPYREFEKGTDKGFGIQVSKAAKSFFIQYKSPVTGKRRYMKLGTYPDTSLSRARKRCQDARDTVNARIDPQIERDEQSIMKFDDLRKAEKQAEIESTTGTVQQLFDAYITRLKADGKSSHKDVQQIYDKNIKPYIGAMKARDVAPEQVKNIVRTVLQRGAGVMANHVRTYLMAAYAYGIKSDYDAASTTHAIFRIETNPARDIPAPARVTPGERNLSADEIRELWDQLENSSMTFAMKTALKLLFATGGQRIEEVLGMRWDELDFDRKVWELTTARTKNKRPHVVPLSDIAINLIRGVQPFSSDLFVFPSRDDKEKPIPARSLSQAVSRFCTPPMGKDNKRKQPTFNKFIPRDIRRTVKSRMGELGLSKEIRDRLHNHALHDVSSKHYDRYDYLPQKKQAMDSWTEWLINTIENNEQPPNVIALRNTR
jgi:integrase